MRIALVITALTVLAAKVLAPVPSYGAELGISDGELRFHHHYSFFRIGPQSCFLMPDVIVAINALGPYCSSPRGYYYHYRRY
jgi:hypothetical protein